MTVESAASRLEGVGLLLSRGDVVLAFVESNGDVDTIEGAMVKAGHPCRRASTLGDVADADTLILVDFLTNHPPDPHLRERILEAGPIIVLVERAHREGTIRRSWPDVIAIVRDTFHFDRLDEPAAAERAGTSDPSR